MAKLIVNESVYIEDSALRESFVRASGPGGQNVNKVSTAVELRLDIEACQALGEEAKARLREIGGRRVTQEGELLIFAQRHRTQEMNRSDARERLAKLVREALDPPKPRVATKPSKGSIRRRLEQKRRDSQAKSTRSAKPSFD